MSSTQEQHLKNIADAIRNKLGIKELIKPSEFANKINSISVNDDGSYTDGYNAGQQTGYQDGYNTGLNAGEQQAWDELKAEVSEYPIGVFTSEDMSHISDKEWYALLVEVYYQAHDYAINTNTDRITWDEVTTMTEESSIGYFNNQDAQEYANSSWRERLTAIWENGNEAGYDFGKGECWQNLLSEISSYYCNGDDLSHISIGDAHSLVETILGYHFEKSGCQG